MHSLQTEIKVAWHDISFSFFETGAGTESETGCLMRMDTICL